MNKKYIIILIGVCFIGLVLGLVWLGSRFNKVEEAKPPETHPLCVGFETVEGEISCDEAIKIAKEKFEGEIESIDKKYNEVLYFQKIDGKEIASLTPISPFPELEDFPELPKVETFERKSDIWFVEMKTETKTVEGTIPEELKKIIGEKTERRETIIIDLHSGEIL